MFTTFKPDIRIRADSDPTRMKHPLAPTHGRPWDRLWNTCHNKTTGVSRVRFRITSIYRTVWARCKTRIVRGSTRVGWAGFPDIAEAALGHPQLCYYEGVIAATVNRHDKRCYLVDGHNAHGISGALVWHWSRDRDRLEVAAVVRGYARAQVPNLPGLCAFEPLDSYSALFKSWQAQWDRERAEASAL